MGSKRLVIGLLAHVDAGKTTLAESILYQSGRIRRLGRVDHKDAFLDTDRQERDRGITIFSKQAQFSWKDMDATLLDTPGHVDFCAEMERALQVLDYAVLIINGADGVQQHTLTLWKLLERYQVPVFLFVNKMDQPGTDRDELLAGLKRQFGDRCVAFGGDREEFYENIAVCDDALLEEYLTWSGEPEKDSGKDLGSGSESTAESVDGCPVTTAKIAALVAGRKVYPCFFGSALKCEGVDEFLDGISTYTCSKRYGEAFGARVFKIARDEQGARLTFVKLTGGSLKVRETISVPDKSGGEDRMAEEKIDQIRIYSGSKYTTQQEVTAGCVCALTGPVRTFCGQGLGAEEEVSLPVLEPVMDYRIILPDGYDVHQMYEKLCQLEEEEPALHIVWKEQVGEIHAKLMGEVQIEILKNLILERFGVEVDFGAGSIVYKETIADTVEGVGHFEPLRHYAEVHLILSPGERGSGLTFKTQCSEDVLNRNWQRLILTHLEEKEHPGVLVGAPITDMEITLVSGRAHTKHTEGGDFRQATYRAVRQGLCKAKSVLLEPVYDFRLEVPSELTGRAMTDMQTRGGHFEAPLTEGSVSVLTGTVPAARMHGYQAQMLAYSGGRGRLSMSFKGYEPCQNAEEVIEAVGYEAEHDMANPCGSVFCAHGAGFVVEWDHVEEYMHLESVLSLNDQRLTDGTAFTQGSGDGQEPHSFAVRCKRRADAHKSSTSEDFIGQDEVEEIFERTFGTNKRDKRQGFVRTIRADRPPAARYTTAETPGTKYKASEPPKDEYLLVDGYNIIFAWENLNELAKVSLDGARGRLMDILSNYQGYRRMHLILVFDAYKVKGNPGSTARYHNIDVVYTKEAETADQYIEKVTHEIGKKYRVRVATSDGLEQLIIMGAGAIRVSAGELLEEVMEADEELRRDFLKNAGRPTGGKNYLLEDAGKEVTEYVERVKANAGNGRRNNEADCGTEDGSESGTKI